MGTKLVEDTNNLKDCFRSLFEVCTEHAYCIFRILLDLDWHYLNAGASNSVFTSHHKRPLTLNIFKKIMGIEVFYII